jgi:hypothetical protein
VAAKPTGERDMSLSSSEPGSSSSPRNGQSGPGPSRPSSSGSGQPDPAARGSGLRRSALLGPSGAPRGRSRMPMRVIVGALSVLLLVGTGSHIVPAIKAGLHDGTRGSWIATTRSCVRGACVWKGKFVLPGGHVVLTSAQYSGRLPAGMHVGTSVAGLYPGGSGLVFPAAGSSLWISLLIAMALALFGLYWSCHRVVAGYLKRRREQPA